MIKKVDYTTNATRRGCKYRIPAFLIVMLILVSLVSVDLYGEPVSNSQDDIVAADSALTITQYTVGETLGSFSDLNVVAMNQGAVFIYIPGSQPAEITSQTRTALLDAQESLLSLEIVVGLYTLSVNSEDYTSITAQIQTPAFVVASQGGGMVPVSGELTRDILIQAYLTASNSTTCGQ